MAALVFPAQLLSLTEPSFFSTLHPRSSALMAPQTGCPYSCLSSKSILQGRVCPADSYLSSKHPWLIRTVLAPLHSPSVGLQFPCTGFVGPCNVLVRELVVLCCLSLCVCVFPTSFWVLEDKEHALFVIVSRTLGRTSDKNKFHLDSRSRSPFSLWISQLPSMAGQKHCPV